MKTPLSILLILFLVLSSSSALMSQGDMTEEEMQAAWTNSMTPGEQQEFMSQLAGEWTYTQSIYMDPAKGPEVSQGKATNTMILGGRYLRESYSGVSMGMQFQGENTLSHNNIDGKWYMSWIDNMGTGAMTGSGVRKGNTIVIECMYPKMSGKGHDSFRITHEIESNEKHTMVMHMLDDASGEYTKWMEIVFTRK